MGQSALDEAPKVVVGCKRKMGSRAAERMAEGMGMQNRGSEHHEWSRAEEREADGQKRWRGG